MSEFKTSVRQGSLAAAIAVLVFASTSSAVIRNVPDDFPTIQEAIAASKDGDEVVVAPGVYNEAIDFLGLAIIVRSSDGPDVTTIDATGLDTSVVSCINLEGPDTVLDGFTITGGCAAKGAGMFIQSSDPTVNNCVFLANTAEAPPFINSQGGGMFNFNSNPMVSNCVFRENICWGSFKAFSQGGGMFNQNSRPIVSSCVFAENAVFHGLATPTQGAGMCNINSDPIVIDCQFIANFAGSSNNGNEGGGMFNDSSSPTVTNCTFQGNVVDVGVGGGMSNAFDSNPTVTNCTFIENDAPFGAGMDNVGSGPIVIDCLFSGNVGNIGGGMSNCAFSDATVRGCTFSGNLAGGPDIAGRGGGMRNNASNPTVTNCVFAGNVAYGTVQWVGGGGMFNNYLASPTVTNCTFVNNEAGATGGAIYNFQGGSPTLINCSLIGNTAGQSGGVMYNTNTAFFESSPSMVNCILWGNSHDQVFDGKNAATTITYSNVEQGWTGDGSNNINADPLFVDPDNDDYHISSGSPCIDAADNTAVPKGIDTDLDGNPRFVDDPNTKDTGNGDPPIVDMGSYEFQTTTTTTPDSYNAFRGFHLSGDLADVLESDDNDLCHNPGIVLNPAEAPITLDFFGTMPNDSPASLDVTIESSANTVGLELTFSFWNYITNSWDVVGTDTQSLNADTVRTFAGNPADHVQPGTGEVRTRYEVRQAGIVFIFPWLDCVDHVFWTTTG